jgi:hypothetical protein
MQYLHKTKERTDNNGITTKIPSSNTPVRSNGTTEGCTTPPEPVLLSISAPRPLKP